MIYPRSRGWPRRAGLCSLESVREGHRASRLFQKLCCWPLQLALGTVGKHLGPNPCGNTELQVLQEGATGSCERLWPNSVSPPDSAWSPLLGLKHLSLHLGCRPGRLPDLAKQEPLQLLGSRL